MEAGLKEEFMEWLETGSIEELVDVANYCFLIWYLKRRVGGEVV